MDRLSALDASFLRVETPRAHMHVGWLSAVDLPPGQDRLDATALLRQVQARLHLTPRFRQVVYTPPAGLGSPVWVDAQDFRIEDHVSVEQSPRMTHIPPKRFLTMPSNPTVARKNWPRPT